jgi:DNA-binding MarR family transcriptional regulator
MDRTTLSRNLSVLEKQGFIKISSGNKDNRTRIITITNRGCTAAAKAVPLWSDVQRKVKQRMGETLWNELMGNLSQFVKVADQLNESK